MEEDINQENIQPTMDGDFVWWKDKRIWIIGVIAILVAVAIVVVIILTGDSSKENDILPGMSGKDGGNGKVVEKAPERDGKMTLLADKTTYSMGDEINVDILMDTMDANIVVASAIVFYNEDELEYIGRSNLADTSNSELDMSIANHISGGVIEVVMGSPGDSDYLDSNDGFNGESGLLASLQFRAKKTGNVSIKFGEKCRQSDVGRVCEKSSLILDDGRGTGMVMEYSDLTLNVQ